VSWIHKLNDTYVASEKAADRDFSKLWPISHVVKNAHVEVILNEKGLFRRARKLDSGEALTLIPVTEASAGRTSGAAAHPLCDELSYCAADLPNAEPERHRTYLDQLERWCRFGSGHEKLNAVLTYVSKGTLWSDLNREHCLPLKVKSVRGTTTRILDKKVFVRWKVEGATEELASGTWEDRSLIDSWIAFDRSENQSAGFCMVSGDRQRLCQSHPRFVRRSDDGGKLISANDFSGFTFRGRFTDRKDDYAKQVCSVGFEVSQRAHSALRWLLARQGYRNSDQAIVSWAVSGQPVPDSFANSLKLLGKETEAITPAVVADTDQAFALRLKRAIAGYRAKLDPKADVVVMGLDSATPGRMAIVFYREFRGSEFLDRVESWHGNVAWHQNFGKDRHFIGAPAPGEIAEAAYGTQLDDTQRKATVERLLPCIIDGRRIPYDLVASLVRRVANRAAFKPSERWQWEKSLGIACSVFRGYYAERNYRMSLEEERVSRDYLFGRLLAVADDIERIALGVANEQRDTNAGRFMQRFADRPCSTWRTIELALSPYKSRLRSRCTAALVLRERLLDEIFTKFGSGEFESEAPLSGEFLLGYHAQRQALRSSKARTDEDDANGPDFSSEPKE
jgi:CRISPR-associated protein Csd1